MGKKIALSVFLVAIVLAISIVILRWSGRLVVMSADGSRDYDTLLMMADGVPDGAIVLLTPGIYETEKCVRFKKSINLIGFDSNKTLIASKDSGCVVQFGPSGFYRLWGVGVIHVGSRPADVVFVTGGKISFYNCQFRGAETGYKDIRRAGLSIIGKTTGTVRGCNSHHNNQAGFLLREGVKVTLVDNLCSDNLVMGIGFFGSSKGKAKRNTCRYNGESGIVVAGVAKPILVGNTVTDNLLAGILYDIAGSGEARRNICSNNGVFGIVVLNFGKPRLFRNECVSNQIGVAYWSMAGGEAEGNRLVGNKIAVGVFLSSRPELTKNICEENELEDIWIRDEARATLINNECRVRDES